MLLFAHLLGIVLVAFGVGAWLRHMLPAKRERLFSKLKRAAAWMRANVQELVGLPAALVVYWLSGLLIRLFEPTSALYDSGVLQGIAVVIIHLLVANSVARFGVALNATRFYKDQPVTPHDRQWLFIVYLLAYCLLAAFI